MKTVVLASGGLDSSVLMLLLKRERLRVLPIHVDYGQLAETREWISLMRFCAATGLSKPKKLNISNLGVVPSGLTNRSRKWRSNPFFPGRNLILAALGASIGFDKSYRTVALGLVANALYPDATQEFLHSASAAISESFGARIRVVAPLLKLSKREVAQLGKRARAPLSLTYSCQLGATKPCGECSSCTDRALALSDS